MADLNAELHEQSDESTRSISPVTLALAEGRSLINTQATSAHEYKNKEDEALATRSALPSKMSKEEGENFTKGDSLPFFIQILNYKMSLFLGICFKRQ